MMLPLHEVVHRYCHIVTKIVETELVVGTESNVAVVCALTFVTVRLVLVYTVYRKAVEHIERAHPLRVTLGEVVVDCDYMDAFSCECVKEYRKGCDEGLTLTGRHLGDLALVEYYTADYLDVIMDHVPGNLVTAGDPVVLVDCDILSVALFYPYEILVNAEFTVKVGCGNLYLRVLREPACGRLHYRESLRKNLHENHLDSVILLLDESVGLGSKVFLLLYRDILFEFALYLLYPLLERCLNLTDTGLESLRMSPQLVIG